LESKRFHTFDNKTFLRALGAASGNDFSSGSMDALRHLPPETLSKAAGQLKNAAQLAADFLATEIGAPRAEALPYANQFAVLCELFRVLPNPNATQLTEIKHWFWLTTLSGYFGGWNSGQMTIDARNIRSFAAGKNSSLKVSAAIPDTSLWLIKPFRSSSAVAKMLGVMLGHRAALDLLTGQKIDADKSLAWSNDREYHHFFPQKYLASAGISSVHANVVGNIVLMTSRSNISIGDAAPSNYLQRIIANDGRDALVKRLESNLIPESALDAALADDYRTFLEVRGSHLHRIAVELAGRTVEDPNKVSAEAIDDSDDDPTE
jgi:hypothetical protein